jgi:hypothetical protein
LEKLSERILPVSSWANLVKADWKVVKENCWFSLTT